MLQRLAPDLLERCAEVDKSTAASAPIEELIGGLPACAHDGLARLITLAENLEDGAEVIARQLDQLHGAGVGKNAPVLGITGTGGSGKSSLVDELVRRYLRDQPGKTIAILSVDPSKRKTGGALLGDLDLALREQTGLAISVADESLNCVALGTGRALEYEKQLRHIIDYDS